MTLSPAFSGYRVMRQLMDIHQRGNLRFPQSLPEFQRLFPTTRPAPPTWRRLAGATGLFAPIVSRGDLPIIHLVFANLKTWLNGIRSRGQSPAPASRPQPIHLPLQQAVLSVQRLPFPARHRGRRHRTLPTQSFTPEPGSILHVGGVGNNRIGKHDLYPPMIAIDAQQSLWRGGGGQAGDEIDDLVLGFCHSPFFLTWRERMMRQICRTVGHSP